MLESVRIYFAMFEFEFVEAVDCDYDSVTSVNIVQRQRRLVTTRFLVSFLELGLKLLDPCILGEIVSWI